MTPFLRSVVAAMAVLLSVGWASAQDFRPFPPGPQASITVTGEGEVRQKPDIAEISLGVVTEAKSAADALRQNNEAMQKLFELLKQRGVDPKDIRTSSFNVTPQRRPERRPGTSHEPAEIVAYQVVNQVQVRLRDLSTLGQVLDEAVQQGANQLFGISYAIADPQALLDQARRQAIEQAHHKAELYAQSVDRKLGQVLMIDEGPQGGPGPIPRLQFRASTTESVPVATGEETLAARVTVTYSLEGR